MKVKTSEATPIQINWLVATCEGKCEGHFAWYYDRRHTFNYSTNWAQGGPIIEREWLDITPWPNESDEDLRWQCKQHDSIDCVAFGPTPLIAAMRCFVASKLGDEVDVPGELGGDNEQ
jgi:hypothetical protein